MGKSDYSVATLAYAVYDGGGWSTAAIANPPVGGCVPASTGQITTSSMQLVLDAAGKPHIVYACPTPYYLHQ
jgi:hypothetical protein